MTVTPLGRLVLASSVLGLALALLFGWSELLALGIAAGLLLLIALLFLLGSSASAAELSLPRARVSVGQKAAVGIAVLNPRGRRVLPGAVELGIDERTVRLPVPGIPARSGYREELSLPTARRGVMRIGPVTAVRSDPVGLLRRDARLAEEVEFTVHPRTVSLAPTGTGLLRDLEGEAGSVLAVSDLSFHAIRDYQAGDDRRSIHWRSTAKTGSYMVRQFEETRRRRLALVHSLAEEDYGDEQAFELGVSVLASIGVRALRDGQQLISVRSSGRDGIAEQPSGTVDRLLDGFSRVQSRQETTRLSELAAQASVRLGRISSVFLVAGAGVRTQALREAASRFSAETRVVAVLCEPEAVPSLRSSGTLSLLRIGYLEDLPRACWRIQGGA